jgi:hypothetical protein
MAPRLENESAHLAREHRKLEARTPKIKKRGTQKVKKAQEFGVFAPYQELKLSRKVAVLKLSHGSVAF